MSPNVGVMLAVAVVDRTLTAIEIAGWAIVPPLLVLIYYNRRIPTVLSLPQLLLVFMVGALTGLVALAIAWSFEYISSSIATWRLISRSLAGIALRQFLLVGPLEEGCKLSGAMLLQRWIKRRNTGFMLTVAIALGFTAEENWIYLTHGTAGIVDRLIGTPVHLMFSAPWGYRLELASRWRFNVAGYRRAIALAWLNAVICHAVVNILASTGRYPSPLRFLSYALFPFLLWMFWRLEQFVRRVRRSHPIVLISSRTLSGRLWQIAAMLLALGLASNALYNLILVARTLSFLTNAQVLSLDGAWFLVSRALWSLIASAIALKIYRYLRRQSN